MKIPDQVTKLAAKQLIVLKKHAPHILFGAGLAGVVTSTVLACRATLKVSDKLDNIQREVIAVKKDEMQPYLAHHATPDIVVRRNLAAVYVHGVYDITKLYAPSVIIGGLSIAALTGSHVSLTRRNNALTAAYVAVSRAFADYRAKVREEVGEQKERELYHKSQTEVVTNADGTKRLVTKTDRQAFVRVFDEQNRNWVHNNESARLFLEANQNAWNVYLRTHKHVFLNDVYKSLGFEPVQAGQIVGWVYDSEKGGDNYIDFGLYEVSNFEAVNGEALGGIPFILEFNVDGIIYDLID
jgi:hypothetical protein